MKLGLIQVCRITSKLRRATHFNADVTTVRRLYLFQRPLSGLESVGTSPGSTRADGGYGLASDDTRMESVLPRILDTFHIVSHLSVIVVDEKVCMDTTSLTALQKLSMGLVHEHAGPKLNQVKMQKALKLIKELLNHSLLWNSLVIQA